MKKHINDIQSVHGICNGKAGVYATGLNYNYAFGPDYSAPTAIKLLFCDNDDLYAETKRVPHTAIWENYVYDEEKQVGLITEFADSVEPIIYRRVYFDKKIRFCAFAEKIVQFYQIDKDICGIDNFIYGEIPEGNSLYIYSYTETDSRSIINKKTLYFGMIVKGEAEIIREDLKTVNILIEKGDILLVFADSFEKLMSLAKKANESDFQECYKNTYDCWCELSNKRQLNCPDISEETAQVFDDIYVLIKTQQSSSGGVLAGTPYRLAYIRDNYGVNRGLLAIGALDESKSLVEYYIDVFKKYGEVHTAQATDTYGFHIHENDSSEITGYMILMIRDYYKHTGDKELLLKAKDLLLWCVAKQHNILQNGMLPFNGDETYIAGFILPREIINHGSMEATALYHESCKWLIETSDILNLENSQLEILKGDKNKIEESFADNFYVDGKIACNNKNYYGKEEQPIFRYGMRLCGHSIGMGVLDKSNRYVCFDCYNLPPRENKEFETIYYLNAPLLMSVYVGTSLLDRDILNKEIDKIADEIVKNDFVYKSDKIVGYELGVLIYAFKERHSELIPKLRQMVLDLRDDLGAWSEYYENNLPMKTMYRPWESGINADAILFSEGANK